MQQARAEQEEEFISNTLFKKIQALQKEKETLAVNYEKEEEFLTNELSRKLMQVSEGYRMGKYLFNPLVKMDFTSLLSFAAWRMNTAGLSLAGIFALVDVPSY